MGSPDRDAIQPDDVRRELSRVLASRAFLKADSLAQFLRFVVERELAGQREQLREQVIAETVFARRDFDPRADTVVRTQARRMRERLAEYYAAEGRDAPVRIVLEKGSYVPVFRGAAAAPAAASIAVLPFMNLTGSAAEEYFSDGLTEEIINVLARVRGLRTVARTSSFAFKSKDLDVREIGRQLHVAAILEGSVRRAGDRVRVTAQLVSTETGFHHWSENYDRPLSDVLQVQDDIAGAIVATLLRAGAVLPPRRTAAVDVDAYHLYLKALQALFRVSTDGVQQAMELFGRAMAADPGFAPAPAYLGLTLANIGWWGMAPAADVLPRARGLAAQALAIDPQSTEARLALAWIRFAFDHDIDGALSDLASLADLAPSSALTHIARSYALIAQRRFDEAAEAARLASELDPLSVVNVYNRAVVAYFGADWDAVERFGHATVDLAPDFAEGHLALGAACMETGRVEQAIPLIERAVALNATIGREYLVVCHCRLGRLAEAEAEFARLLHGTEVAYVAPHRLAVAASAFPDPGRALAYLEQAWRERDPRLIWLAAWPVFDHLGAHPRVAALCARLGLTARAV